MLGCIVHDCTALYIAGGQLPCQPWFCDSGPSDPVPIIITGVSARSENAKCSCNDYKCASTLFVCAGHVVLAKVGGALRDLARLDLLAVVVCWCVYQT